VHPAPFLFSLPLLPTFFLLSTAFLEEQQCGTKATSAFCKRSEEWRKIENREQAEKKKGLKPAFDN